MSESIPEMYVLPCGSIARIDMECSSFSNGGWDYVTYRCTSCMAVPGSMGQPKTCQELELEKDKESCQ